MEHRHPQPWCIALHAQHDALTAGGAALAEGCLDVDHANDRRAENGRRRLVQPSESQDVRARLHCRLRAPGDLIASPGEGDHLLRDRTDADAIPAYDLERRVEPALRDQIEHGNAPSPGAPRADRREQAPISRECPRRVAHTDVVDLARGSPGGAWPTSEEEHRARQKPVDQLPTCHWRTCAIHLDSPTVGHSRTSHCSVPRNTLRRLRGLRPPSSLCGPPATPW